MKILGFAATALLVGCGGGDGGTAPPPPPPTVWNTPSCATVSGLSTIAFSPDGGTTLVMPSDSPHGGGNEGVYAVVPLVGVPNRLVAYFNGVGNLASFPPALFLSSDAGCSWTRTVVLSARGSNLVPGGGNFALGWTYENGESIVWRVDAMGVLTSTTTFVGQTEAIVANPTLPNQLRRIGHDFTVRDNFSSGVGLWPTVGTVSNAVIAIRSVAFDSANINRFAVGGLSGIVVTTNGSQSWVISAFDTGPQSSVSAHSLAYSKDGSVIWARGLDDVTDQWRLYRSLDGGVSFSSVAVEGTDVVMANSLVAHPTDPNLVYWSGGKFGDPTTHLYQYSSLTGLVTRVELSDGSPFFDVHAFAFHPTNPNYLYFGLIWPGP